MVNITIDNTRTTQFRSVSASTLTKSTLPLATFSFSNPSQAQTTGSIFAYRPSIADMFWISFESLVPGNLPGYGFGVEGCPELTPDCFSSGQEVAIVCYNFAKRFPWRWPWTWTDIWVEPDSFYYHWFKLYLPITYDECDFISSGPLYVIYYDKFKVNILHMYLKSWLLLRVTHCHVAIYCINNFRCVIKCLNLQYVSYSYNNSTVAEKY